MNRNDYYAIASNDLQFLQSTLNTTFYNQIAIQAQQIAEKLLKSVAERTCVGIEKLMISHNLRGIYDKIHENEKTFTLDRGDLHLLEDMYYNAEYPGENFVEADRETCQECLAVMHTVLRATNTFREKHQLKCFKYEELYLGETGGCAEAHGF